MSVVRPHQSVPAEPGFGVRGPDRSTAARRRRVASVLGRIGLAGILVGTLAVGPAATVPKAEGITAPRCTYADTLTRYRARSDWYRSLLDTRYRLSSTYAPLDLVPVTRSGASGSGYIRRIALADLTAMYRAARAAGAPFAVQSAYRSYRTQVSTFNRWVALDGYRTALLGSARPGHSEHQLGTAVDLKTPGGAAPWNYADWGQTRAGAWLARNSWRYGFVLSYPKGKTAATCYQYESWHFRYYGRIIAAKIHKSGLTARQWLYVKGATGTWTGGGPAPTPTPTPTPTPSPTPPSSPSPTPSQEPSQTPGTEPSPSPSDGPSPSASESPSTDPGSEPGETPSDAPSNDPSGAPSNDPSGEPTSAPGA